MFGFFKRKKQKSGRELAEESNRDFAKMDWLDRVLTQEESTVFYIAHSASLFYDLILTDKEPTKERSKEMKQFIREFRQEVKQIIKDHAKAEITERDAQVEQLIRDAEFQEEYRYIPHIYCYMRKLSPTEQGTWEKKNDRLSDEFFGPMR